MPILRDIFLKLSTNQAMRSFVTRFPLSRRVSRRFVAGETLDEAIGVVKKLDAQGLAVTLDQLGESVTSQAEAREAKDGYLRALNALAQNQVASHVSVKLTQMGLDLNTDLCLANMREIIGKAKAIGTFVRVDMEDSPRTQATLNIFKTLRAEFDNVGIVIQAYLYRSQADMQAFRDRGAGVRLCKGAYKEPAEIAFPLKKDVDENYRKLAQLYLDSADQAYLALATHDEKIIRWAKEYVAAHHIAHTQFEFQMLYGIRTDLQRQLVQEGFTMRVYVPYGTHWYPYFMRRMAERPANAIFLLSNLFK